MSNQISDKISHYQRESEGVGGWVEPEFFTLLQAASDYHQNYQVAGSILETGVYQGRSLLAFGQCAVDGEIVVGIDLFDDAYLSKDSLINSMYKSSLESLSLSLVKTHVQKFSENPDKFHFFKGFAADKHGEVQSFLEGNGQKIRMISIDGGHSEVDVFKDLLFSNLVCSQRALMFVDDIFNPQWPGVMTAVVRFVAQESCVWRPVVLGGNKLILTNSHHSDCLSFLKDALGKNVRRQDVCEFMGTEIINLYS